MRYVCTLHTINPVWIADRERMIFGICSDASNNEAVYMDREGLPLCAAFHENTKCCQEKEQEHEYAPEANGGLVLYGVGEPVEEIDDLFGCFGFKDTDGNVVIRAQYAWAGEFVHGLCPVNLNRTWYKDESGREWYENHFGYIDVRGKTVIPFRFDWASEFNRYGVAAVSSDGEGTCFIDTTGKVLDRVASWSFPALHVRYEERFIVFPSDEPDSELVGLYDSKERRILVKPEHYTDFIELDEMCIQAESLRQENSMAESVFLNNKGEPIVFPTTYSKIKYLGNGYFACVLENATHILQLD